MMCTLFISAVLLLLICLSIGMSSRRAHAGPRVGVPTKVLPVLGVQTQELLPKAPEDAKGSFAATSPGACVLEEPINFLPTRLHRKNQRRFRASETSRRYDHRTERANLEAFNRACPLFEPQAQGVSSRHPRVPEPPMPAENWQKPRRRLRRHAKALARSQKPFSQQSPTSPQVRRRAKRFIYPGTLWCGPGTNANSFDELGSYKKTDICCREHDHCPHAISGFEHKYGYNNIGWHTISHCDCDNKFRKCMKESNDTAAWDIGRTYFSIVGVPCFTLREDEGCVDWSWWAGCLKYERTMMAIIQEQGPFDEVPPASNSTEVPTEEVERQETTTPAHSGGGAISGTTTGPPVSTSTSFQSPNVDSSFNAPTALSESLSTLSTTRSPKVSSRGPSGGDGRKWKKFWRKYCSEHSKEKDLSDERAVHCKAFKGRLHRYNSVAVAEGLTNASGVVATLNGRSSADGDTSTRVLTMVALQQMQQSNVSDTEERAFSEKGNARADAAVRPTSPAPANNNATAHAGTEENALRQHAGLDPLLTKANRSRPRKTTGQMNGKRQKSPAKGPAAENSALHKGGVVTTDPAFSTAEPAFTAACTVVTDSMLVPDAFNDVSKRSAARKGDVERQQTGGKRDAEKVEENTRRLVAGYVESVSEVLSGLVKRLNRDAKEPHGLQRRGRVSHWGIATAPKRGHSDEKWRVRNSSRGRRPSGLALVVGQRPLAESRRVREGTWLALVERRLGGLCQPPAVVERRRCGGEQSSRGESRRRGRGECVGRKVPFLEMFAFYAKAYELSEQ